ncbi:hypothetical protein SVAN01_11954 [Stagonosporopsis vannaccii]|nr:hypothetical protein SVAN01_11954 [Stagonosporopsis vannaccii]
MLGGPLAVRGASAPSGAGCWGPWQAMVEQPASMGRRAQSTGSLRPAPVQVDDARRRPVLLSGFGCQGPRLQLAGHAGSQRHPTSLALAQSPPPGTRRLHLASTCEPAERAATANRPHAAVAMLPHRADGGAPWAA